MKAISTMRKFASSTFTKANGAKLMRKIKDLPPIIPILVGAAVLFALTFWVSDTLGWFLVVALIIGLFAAFWFPREFVKLVKEVDAAARKHWKVVCECAVEAWKVLTRKGSTGTGTGGSSGSSSTTTTTSGSTTPTP
jgi:hypothetical protein